MSSKRQTFKKLGLAAALVTSVLTAGTALAKEITLLNVTYDPTR